MYRLISFPNGEAYLDLVQVEDTLPDNFVFSRGQEPIKFVKSIEEIAPNKFVIDGTTEISGLAYRTLHADGHITQIGTLGLNLDIIITPEKVVAIQSSNSGFMVYATPECSLTSLPSLWDVSKCALSPIARSLRLRPIDSRLLGDATIEYFHDFPLQVQKAKFLNGVCTHVLGVSGGLFKPALAFVGADILLSNFDFDANLVYPDGVIELGASAGAVNATRASIKKGEAQVYRSVFYNGGLRDLVRNLQYKFALQTVSEDFDCILYNSWIAVTQDQGINVKVDVDLSNTLSTVLDKISRAEEAAYEALDDLVNSALRRYYKEVSDMIKRTLSIQSSYVKLEEFSKAYARKNVYPTINKVYISRGKPKNGFGTDFNKLNLSIASLDDVTLAQGVNDFKKSLSGILEKVNDDLRAYKCRVKQKYVNEKMDGYWDSHHLWHYIYEKEETWFRSFSQPSVSDFSFGFAKLPFLEFNVTGIGVGQMRGTHPYITIDGEDKHDNYTSGQALNIAKRAVAIAAENCVKRAIESFKEELSEYYSSDELFFSVKVGKGETGSYEKDWTYGGHGDCEIQVSSTVRIYLKEPSSSFLEVTDTSDAALTVAAKALKETASAEDFERLYNEQFTASVEAALKGDSDFMDALQDLAVWVHNLKNSGTSVYLKSQEAGLVIQLNQANLLPYLIRGIETLQNDRVYTYDIAVVIQDGDRSITYSLEDILSKISVNKHTVANTVKLTDFELTCNPEFAENSAIATLVANNFQGWVA